ncbi:MAG: carbohydrate kinase family protein [Thermoplasmata archaeon]|nr:MAG: carbohydrate kinase family protein [Thermoplasmata archaeon]
MHIVGLGALNLDRLYKVPRITKGDEEIAILEAVEEPGGSAANTIYALRKLGMSAGFIGAVGNDPEAKKVLGSLDKVGVDTSHIKIKANAQTGLVIGIVDPQGERALYIAPNANNLLTYRDLDREHILGADILHMSSFVSDKQLEVQKKAVRMLNPVTKLSFAPGSLYVKKGLDAISPIIERSHVLFINESEAKTLIGKEYESVSNFLIDSGCKIVAVTLKDKGCFITDGNESYHVEAVNKNVMDTTGAGDAFCAGFLFGLSQERKLRDCGLLGNIVAGRCISKIGARSGLPKISELENTLAELI